MQCGIGNVTCDLHFGSRVIRFILFRRLRFICLCLFDAFVYDYLSLIVRHLRPAKRNPDKVVSVTRGLVNAIE